MRALWKGAINFGLVTIPVSLYPATRREELKFRLLRSSDLSPVNYKRQLIESMTSDWDPNQYTDEYHEALEKMIEQKIEHGGEEAPETVKKKKPTNVIDLVSVLQKSIQQTQSKTKPKNATKKAGATRRKRAA
jgi:non-homologous end joining protein Ku